jgi:hypothetical protein
MQKYTLAATLGLLLTFTLAPIAKAETAPITEEEAHAIGVDAYLYFYPLITMDLTRLQFTNAEPGKDPLKGIQTARSTFISRAKVREPTRKQTGYRHRTGLST